jgi:hypothetical protein
MFKSSLILLKDVNRCFSAIAAERGGLITQSALHSRYIRVTSTFRKAMSKTKIATLNLRIDPGVKEAVREAADRDHRSIANMIEMLIRRHCDDAGITIPQQSDLFPEKPNG